MSGSPPGVGGWLRATREAKGQSLADVERVTRIRAKHLAALEADNFEALPSLAQARGFLRNYAQHLGLDAADILQRFEAGRARRGRLPRLRPAPRPAPPLQMPPPRGATRRPARSAHDSAEPAAPASALAPPAEPAAPSPPAGPPPARPPVPVERRRPPPGSALGRAPQVRSRRPRLLSADVLVAVVVTGALAALLVWGGSQLAAGAAAPPTPTSDLLALFNTPAATVAPTEPPPPTATAPPPTPAGTFTGVSLTVRAEQRTWVGVQVDGVEVFGGLMPPGEAREFYGQSVVEVVTGNGLGTRVIWNGVDQGVLGDYGQVVVRLWTLEGMQTPTPTPAPAAGEP